MSDTQSCETQTSEPIVGSDVLASVDEEKSSFSLSLASMDAPIPPKISKSQAKKLAKMHKPKGPGVLPPRPKSLESMTDGRPPAVIDTVDQALSKMGKLPLVSDYSKIPSYQGQIISIRGWVDKVRAQGKMWFLILRSADHKVQVIILDASRMAKLPVESYVQLIGTVKLLEGKAHSFLPVEIQMREMSVLSLADESYPAQCPPDAGVETRMERRHLYLRDEKFATITRCRAQLLDSMREYMKSTECLEILPPMFTSVECEGGASLFSLTHPGKSSDKPMMAYLPQSSQFALEYSVPALGDCYCLSESYRSEHSHTRRHLTSFTHLESEYSGILTFEDHLQRLRDLLKGILRYFLITAEKTLRKLDKYDRVKKLALMAEDILVMTHFEAIQKCRELGIHKDDGTPFGDREDIPEAQERKLVDTLDRIIFLVKFPKEFKSFYMALDPEDPSLVLGCDVEVPGVGEIIGSGCREHDHERLYQRLIEAGLKPDDYQEYLDLRKFGFGFTSGMGLGVDRLLTWLLEAHSIRDVVTFPRYPGYLRP